MCKYWQQISIILSSLFAKTINLQVHHLRSIFNQLMGFDAVVFRLKYCWKKAKWNHPTAVNFHTSILSYSKIIIICCCGFPVVFTVLFCDYSNSITMHFTCPCQFETYTKSSQSHFKRRYSFSVNFFLQSGKKFVNRCHKWNKVISWKVVLAARRFLSIATKKFPI